MANPTTGPDMDPDEYAAELTEMGASAEEIAEALAELHDRPKG